jgi:transposase-like protein
MTADLTNPMFNDEDAARAHLESIRWPDGPICPHCGVIGNAVKLEGKSTRPGVFKCREKLCRKPFSVTVGTVYERSHIPLHKWLLATHLMASSKKGMSAHQLHRMLGLAYRSAWFMAMRIREAMRDTTSGPLGGENKVVEIDETYVGGKARNRKGKVPSKEAVVSLVERDGRVRSFHVATVTAKTLKPVIKAHVDRASYIMTDESPVYPSAVDGISHGSVNHSAEEYVRAGFWHTNTVESYFSVLKRGIHGTYHHVSPAHLHRYAIEFDFRHNERSALGVDDKERALKALKGIAGKRLTLRQPAG